MFFIILNSSEIIFNVCDILKILKIVYLNFLVIFGLYVILGIRV